jgi:hypothetical protein
MPQVVAVWCRRLGHRVHYATYWGIGDPRRALPDGLDIVFISCHTHLAPLASALATLYRASGTRTVIGGPHARCYPADSARWFDVTVIECDETVIADIAADRFAPGSVVTAARPLSDLVPLAERLGDVRSATFGTGRAWFGSVVPMIAGLGCPYECDFCVDGERRYHALPADRLADDLRLAARDLTRATLFFHDPNFGVGIDAHLDALANAGGRLRYVAEASLGLLSPERTVRLRQTGCTLLATGIESWSGYAGKTGSGEIAGTAKLESTLARLSEIGRLIPFLQATFILGLDCDRGDEPFALTAEFIRRAPHVWTYINSPFAFGGTPLHRRAAAEGRLLGAMPFSCYKTPFLTVVPAHYDPVTYLDRLAGLHALIASPAMLRARLGAARTTGARAEHMLRTLAAGPHAHWLRTVADAVARDPALRAFHEGRSDALPEMYRRAHARRLGRYAALVPAEAARPLRDAPDIAPIVVGRSPAVGAATPTRP